MFPPTRVDVAASPKVIAINPTVAFGRPMIARNGVTTAVIGERFQAGESVTEIADDYDLDADEVEEAIRYEAQARAA